MATATVRVEVTTAGQLNVWVPVGDSPVSRVDVTGFRVPLFIDRGVSSTSTT